MARVRQMNGVADGATVKPPVDILCRDDKHGAVAHAHADDSPVPAKTFRPSGKRQAPRDVRAARAVRRVPRPGVLNEEPICCPLNSNVPG
jgi:hypothetical protein